MERKKRPLSIPEITSSISERHTNVGTYWLAEILVGSEVVMSFEATTQMNADRWVRSNIETTDWHKYLNL